MTDKKSVGEPGKGLHLLQKLLQNDRARKIMIAVGIAAILLIFLSGFFGNGKKSAESAADTAQQTMVGVQSVEEFKTQTENSLTALINEIQGVGNVSVLVTIEKSAQQIYATEEKTTSQTQRDSNTASTTKNQANNSNETKYVVIKNADGTQQPIAVTEVQPIVKGVVVVCSGGNDPVIQQKVTQAVTTALDITSARVCVMQSKS